MAELFHRKAQPPRRRRRPGLLVTCGRGGGSRLQAFSCLTGKLRQVVYRVWSLRSRSGIPLVSHQIRNLLGTESLTLQHLCPTAAIQGRNATGQVGFSSQTRACLLVSGAFASKMPVACTSPLFNEFHSFEGRIWIWKFSMIFKL